MGLVFRVGEQKDVPPKPVGFPKCGSWLPKEIPVINPLLSNWEANDIKLSADLSNSPNKRILNLRYDISDNPYSKQIDKSNNSVKHKISFSIFFTISFLLFIL